MRRRPRREARYATPPLTAAHWYDALLPPPRFAAADEADYLQQWRLPQALRLQRLAGWMGTAMYLGALMADALFAHRLSDPLLFYLFGALGVAMTGLLSLATYSRRLAPHAHTVALGTLLVNGVALIGVTALTQQSGDPFPHFWTLVLLSYTFVMTGLPYRLSAPLGIGLGVLDIAVGIYLDLPVSLLADRILLDVSMLATGLVGSATLERSDRQGWQRAQLMQAQSYSDELTGLRNRRYLFEEGGQRIQYADLEDLPIALLMIDVDYFKRYNDSLGHPAGDRCLIEVAATLKAAGPHPLDIAARIGGEEFAVLLFACDLQAALAVAGGLHSALEQRRLPHPASPSGQLSVSIGVAATVVGGVADLEALLLLADKALYRAKQGGRNQVGS